MKTTSRPLRRLAVLTVTLLAGAATLAPATATAPSGVTGADLPQTFRVANTFPYLEGGTRQLLRSDRLEVADRGCRYQGRGKKATSVRFSSYLTAAGDSPYFDGREDPTYVVYEFAGPARARSAYRAVADFVRRCHGSTVTDLGSVDISTFPLPRLGARQVGYRTVTVEDGDRREDLEVYVLHGKRIERSWIQLDEGSASVRHVTRMARLLSETARR